MIFSVYTLRETTCLWVAVHDFDKSPGLSAVEFYSRTLVVFSRFTETTWKDETSLSLNPGSITIWILAVLTGWCEQVTELFLKHNSHIFKRGLIMLPPSGLLGWLNEIMRKSWETLGWKKYKLESRFPGEISITSDMQMTPPLWQKVKRN